MRYLSYGGGLYKSFYHRIVNLCLAAIVVVLIGFVYQANHSITSPDYLDDVSSKILVKVSGNVVSPGIYFVNDSSMTDSVIKMANNVFELDSYHKTAVYDQHIKNGSDVNVSNNGAVIIGSMSVKQKIILNIPLKISEMNESDLLDVPGIGPGLANNIINYRQNNGGKICLNDLTNVTGIGVSKYNQLKKYFK